MNSKLKLHIAIVFALIFLSASSFGQKKPIRPDRQRPADSRAAQGTKIKISGNPPPKYKGKVVDGERIFTWWENVIIDHEGTKIYCDSVIYFESNNMAQVYGNVRIVEDSVVITSHRGVYYGNTKKSELRGNVVFKKQGDLTLYTNYLDYDQPSRLAYYYNGGKLVDSENTLTSTRGYLNEYQNLASFAKNVHVENNDFQMDCDTMQYHTTSKIVYFRSPTQVVDKEGKTAKYESGFYNTISGRSSLRNSEFETPNYYLQGMETEADEINQLYKARGNVVLISKDENVIIKGTNGIYDKKNGWTKVYGNAILKRMDSKGDTLYLKADTLLSRETEIEDQENLYAYKNVRIFKSDFQGKADSVAFNEADSMMQFFESPVIWSKGVQLSADTIEIRFNQGRIDKMLLNTKSFIISQDTFKLFNQVKGREMIAHFQDSELKWVEVNGNAESVYFLVDEQKLKLMGMDRVICSNIHIDFQNSTIKDIRYLTNVEANVYPPKEITKNKARLDGFLWQVPQKPKLEEFIDYILHLRPPHKRDPSERKIRN